MANLTKKNQSKTISDNTKVTASIIYRMVSPEDRKNLDQLAKNIARKHGLIANVIEK